MEYDEDKLSDYIFKHMCDVIAKVSLTNTYGGGIFNLRQFGKEFDDKQVFKHFSLSKITPSISKSFGYTGDKFYLRDSDDRGVVLYLDEVGDTDDIFLNVNVYWLKGWSVVQSIFHRVSTEIANSKRDAGVITFNSPFYIGLILPFFRLHLYQQRHLWMLLLNEEYLTHGMDIGKVDVINHTIFFSNRKSGKKEMKLSFQSGEEDSNNTKVTISFFPKKKESVVTPQLSSSSSKEDDLCALVLETITRDDLSHEDMIYDIIDTITFRSLVIHRSSPFKVSETNLIKRERCAIIDIVNILEDTTKDPMEKIEAIRFYLIRMIME